MASITTHDYNDRGIGIVDPDKLQVPIAIIGAGSVGSFTALLLAKMGCTDITVYDPDTIETVNVGCQLYGPADRGEYKVIALRRLIKQQTRITIKVVKARFEDKKNHRTPLVIFCTDSIEARREHFTLVRKHHIYRMVIDARMGGENMVLFTTNMDDAEDIKHYTEIDLEVTPAPLPCTERSVVYNVSMLAALITNQVKRLCLGQPYARSITVSLPSLLFMHSKLKGGEDEK